MSSPILVPFRAEHMRKLVNREATTQEPWTLTLEKQAGGPAVTAMDGDMILGCAGLLLPWPGIAMAWMVLSEQIGEHGIWMTTMVRRFLDDAIRVYALHRIEAVVLADSTRNRRWIERLGFTQENGCARAYSQDQRDAIRYEWIRR